GLILFFAIKFRRRAGATAPESTKTNLFLEVTWTALPLAISLCLFVAGAILFDQAYSYGPDRAYEIYVVGKQWMWKFEHPSGRREINEVHLPLGQPVRFIM